jgi:glycosyltransferase involved in cell wall biosynthesis
MESIALRVVHLLRKCNPAEWGGTESAIQRLVEGLRQNNVRSTVYCPRLHSASPGEPLAEAGCTVKRFKAFLPIWGLSRKQKLDLVSVGGNLMSFDLIGTLRREPGVSVIHTHTLGRLGGIALVMARRRRVPFVVTIHGGFLDLPESLKKHFHDSAAGGWEWGKIWGLLFQSRRVVPDADAVLTCNPKEAELLRERYPRKRILVQPHGVPAGIYRVNHREKAQAAFPQICSKEVLLCLGRIDPVKNQAWLLHEAKALLQRHPQAVLVFAGACTNQAYGASLQLEIQRLGLENRVLLLGGFPSTDPRLIGLLQLARAVIIPSISETFGLVILEAWAAGAPVIASRTSGALALIQHGRNGWLFDLENAPAFHEAIDRALLNPGLATQLAADGQQRVAGEFDTTILAGRLKNLYEQLIEETNPLCHSARR